MARFKVKTAVITDSGRRRGLGEAIGLRLARDGANIILSDIESSRDGSTGAEHIGSTDEMESIANELKGLGVEASTCVCDVRSFEEVRNLANHAAKTHGPLDIWVNNAGIGYIMKSLLDVTEEDWRAVIDVILSGAFFGVKSVVEIMTAQGKGGRIINIASQATKSGFPHAQAYTSSKHGLVGLTRSAAIELGSHKLRSTMFAPTMSQPAWGLGRMNISLKSQAQQALKTSSKLWLAVFLWAVPAFQRIQPMLWRSFAQVKRNILQPSA